jgi:hypothetical protein
VTCAALWATFCLTFDFGAKSLAFAIGVCVVLREPVNFEPFHAQTKFDKNKKILTGYVDFMSVATLH